MLKVKKLMKYLNGQKKLETIIPKWNFYKILINKEGKIEILSLHSQNLHQKKLLKKSKIYFRFNLKPS